MSTSAEASAATQATPATVSREGITPFRLTVEQFERMIDAGILGERDRVELLGGVLVAKMTKNDPHNFACRGLLEALRLLLPADWLISAECSVVIGRHWRPEPAVAVIRGPNERYRGGGPQAGDIVLAIEVADTSYAKDRGVKWRRYAACGISSYWIVNLDAGAIEVYVDPTGRGRSAAYRGSTSYKAGDEIPVVLDGHEAGRVNAHDVLP